MVSIIRCPADVVAGFDVSVINLDICALAAFIYISGCVDHSPALYPEIVCAKCAEEIRCFLIEIIVAHGHPFGGQRGAAGDWPRIEHLVGHSANAVEHGVFDHIFISGIRKILLRIILAGGNRLIAVAGFESPPDIILNAELACFETAARVCAALLIFDIDGFASGEIHKYIISPCAAGSVFEVESFALAVARANARADECRIAEHRHCDRLCVCVFGIAGAFGAMIAARVILYRKEEFIFAGISEVVIERVVRVECRYEMRAIHRAAEPFEAVVVVIPYFDVIDGRAAADSAHRQAVDLVVGADVRAAMADRNIAEYARVVVVVRILAAAEFAARFARGNAFDLRNAAGGVYAGLAEDDNAAPATARIDRHIGKRMRIVVFECEDNRVVGGAFGVDFAAAGNDQRAGALRFAVFAFDHGSGLDIQHSAVLYEYESVEDIYIIICPGNHFARIDTCIVYRDLCCFHYEWHQNECSYYCEKFELHTHFSFVWINIYL